MSYKKAECVLPIELVELIQDYIDGEYLYIPRKVNDHKAWGTNTDTRKELMARNQKIYDEYKSGVKVEKLAETYYLSEKSIWRIIKNLRV